MKRGSGLYITDIKTSIAKIERYTKGILLDNLKKDEKTIDAVIRNLGIIGEAAKNIRGEIKDKYPDVPWREIIGMRNKVIHEYFGVDIDILWKTIKEDVPMLKKRIREIKILD